MHLARRWGGVLIGAAAVALCAFVVRNRTSTLGAETRAEAAPASDPEAPRAMPGGSIEGTVEVPGLDPRGLRVRCTPLRWEPPAAVREAEVEPSGRFVLADLEDTDHRIELLSRAGRVLWTLDHARPGTGAIHVDILTGSWPASPAPAER
jgi:hypothetical protein